MSEFQQSLQQKDKAITDLQQTISAVTLPEDHLIVVGGLTQGANKTDSVEILQ